ncbi:hypothetical protein VE01_01042 [Pseudogymnoascus verrucosus]|uniref:Uncharacterized protein n=1 Tax=Pseudogymnoascus verrucosus TaxID=342668 RepID=A0A1B8GXE2_9PEZI|nr:uncharacterized protein VE01_01042 [Pseudogymnoascus verrucosus]OBU00523.1 hypothetical protein VE01_01042 [Pseudogymnoascus verrucosus]
MAIKGVGETKLETVSQGDVEVEVVDVAVDIEVVDVAVEVEDEAKPKVHFPTAGGTGGCLIHFSPNLEQMKGALHTTSTLDYIFIINGTIELRMASREIRILNKGDSTRNTLRTEPAMMAAVSVGIEGAVEDEMRIVGVMGEGEGKEKGE